MPLLTGVRETRFDGMNVAIARGEYHSRDRPQANAFEVLSAAARAY